MSDIETRPVGRPCSVCAHPELEQIHAALIDGASFGRVSLAFAPLTRNSVRRHALNHLPPAVAAEVDGAGELTPTGLLGRVLDVARSARETRAEALELGHHNVALRAGDAELRALSALAALGVRDESEVERRRAIELDQRILGTLIRAFPELAIEAEREYRAHDYFAAAERIHALISRNSKELTA